MLQRCFSVFILRIQSSSCLGIVWPLAGHTTSQLKSNLHSARTVIHATRHVRPSLVDA